MHFDGAMGFYLSRFPKTIIMEEVEKTQPRIFHIHIDAKKMSEDFYKQAVKELRFTDTDFDGHPEGYVHFEPQKHLTLKLNTQDDFKSAWKRLESMADGAEFIGYLEGEFIPHDEYIPYKDYRDLPVPFKISRRRLNGGASEEFRQTEIHLTFEKTKSNRDLIKKLLDSGLYGAYIPKKDGVFLVLTIQGYIRDIEKLYPVLRQYLYDSGGAYRCTLKEERALKYKLYGIGADDLPEIASEVVIT